MIGINETYLVKDGDKIENVISDFITFIGQILPHIDISLVKYDLLDLR